MWYFCLHVKRLKVVVTTQNSLPSCSLKVLSELSHPHVVKWNLNTTLIFFPHKIICDLLIIILLEKQIGGDKFCTDRRLYDFWIYNLSNLTTAKTIPIRWNNLFICETQNSEPQLNTWRQHTRHTTVDGVWRGEQWATGTESERILFSPSFTESCQDRELRPRLIKRG